MAYQKRGFGGGKKFGKSQFVRVGNMFKSDKAPRGAAFSQDVKTDATGVFCPPQGRHEAWTTLGHGIGDYDD